MPIKSIFVPFLSKQDASVGFKAAAVIAEKFDAHIAAASMRQRPLSAGVVYFPLGGVYPLGDDDALKRAEEKNVSKLRLQFDDLCDEHGVGINDIARHSDAKGATASWRDLKGRIPEDLARTASSFDLAVAAAPGPDDKKFQWRLVEELLFSSGRPLFLSPKEGVERFPNRIVIAWNGSVEAAAAIAAALPFMKYADMVKILSVHDISKRNTSTTDLAASLRLHGVETSETEIELEKGQDHIDVMVHEVVEANADLVVMGAYSHNRWREAVFGGFTRHMLKTTAAPMLMAR
ncbi:MAG: universal stress protein [Marinicaulis sp.]|nr:universal stress protein [Marinicaulis sp.]